MKTKKKNSWELSDFQYPALSSAPEAWRKMIGYVGETQERYFTHIALLTIRKVEDPILILIYYYIL